MGHIPQRQGQCIKGFDEIVLVVTYFVVVDFPPPPPPPRLRAVHWSGVQYEPTDVLFHPKSVMLVR